MVHAGVIAPESANADNRDCGDVPERQKILLVVETADWESGKLATGLTVRDHTKLLCVRPFKQGDLSAMIRRMLHRAVQHEQDAVVLVGERIVQPGFRERRNCFD